MIAVLYTCSGTVMSAEQLNTFDTLNDEGIEIIYCMTATGTPQPLQRGAATVHDLVVCQFSPLIQSNGDNFNSEDVENFISDAEMENDCKDI